MKGEDWFFLALVLPVMVIGGWFNSYRIWRRRADLSPAIAWATGAGAPGYHAFLLPATIGFTLLWLGIIVHQAGSAGATLPHWLSQALPYVLLSGVGFNLFGLWLWLTRWPGLLVPRHLRRPHR